ncbi:hypothetical protein HYPSUDRAFT_211531 [Hypholoma sublateritium FD-334 SS-4]|uniref:Uncharacterized protein n=1 Tax=Hypholoma sublateritium (strain FD-334 SS-4) TaxID=945553 RepID=A0A0D2MXS9_HYPSF|nr:hypothetical protein HYPSUDRAFT_211531 [Hypholoma sublateritium FD-334 SS-4]
MSSLTPTPFTSSAAASTFTRNPSSSLSPHATLEITPRQRMDTGWTHPPGAGDIAAICSNNFARDLLCYASRPIRRSRTLQRRLRGHLGVQAVTLLHASPSPRLLEHWRSLEHRSHRLHMLTHLFYLLPRICTPSNRGVPPSSPVTTQYARKDAQCTSGPHMAWGGRVTQSPEHRFRAWLAIPYFPLSLSFEIAIEVPSGASTLLWARPDGFDTCEGAVIPPT